LRGPQEGDMIRKAQFASTILASIIHVPFLGSSKINPKRVVVPVKVSKN
jgi:hypothetical protein